MSELLVDVLGGIILVDARHWPIPMMTLPPMKTPIPPLGVWLCMKVAKIRNIAAFAIPTFDLRS